MRKTLLCSIISLGLCAHIAADITSYLEGYTKMECTLSQRSETDKKHHHKEKHKKSKTSSKKTKPTPHTPHPNVVIDRGISTNWSGYVAMTNINSPTAGSVSAVSGTWTVPQLIATPDTSYSAIWVGIDGYSDSTVEQLGTEHVWINGTQQNLVWFEMYPGPAYQIDIPVAVGDVIEAEVEYTGNSQFVLSIVNHTQNIYTTVPAINTRSSSAQRKCAEWIVEAPYSAGILPLSDFQTVYFSNCSTVINGVTGGIASPYWQADDITMVVQGGSPSKAVPSSLSPDYSSFSVTWGHE